MPRLPTQHEYEMEELKRAMAHLRETERQPLADRKEAQAAWVEAMQVPGLVAERLGWLIDGNYGFGPMKMAHNILARPRMNHEAALSHLVAEFEWACPGVMAVAAWKKIPPAAQKRLKQEIEAEIKSAKRRMAE